jgi:hypothetical protein
MEIDTTRMGPAQPPRQLFPTFSGLHAIHPSASSKRKREKLQTRGPKEGIDKIVNNLRRLNLSLTGEVSFDNQGLDDDDLEEIAQHVQNPHLSNRKKKRIEYVKGFIEARDPCNTQKVDLFRKTLLAEYAGTVFDTHTTGDPKVRGTHGLAEIILKPKSRPVKQKMFQIQGERRAAWIILTDQIIADGKVEPGIGPWNSPSFPVPKKKPGEYRLVEDFRRVNDATVDDAHPLLGLKTSSINRAITKSGASWISRMDTTKCHSRKNTDPTPACPQPREPTNGKSW